MERSVIRGRSPWMGTRFIVIRAWRDDSGSSRIALRSIRATGNCGARLRTGLARQTVGAFVGRMAGVTPQPVPTHFVALERRVEPLPQVDVADRLLVRGAPALAVS